MIPQQHLALGTEPIPALLRRYAIPSIVAMVATSLYNMMDSVFIGHGCGPLAIAGLGVTFPFMNLAAAFGAMVGVGVTTVISIKLGQKDYHSAELALGNVIFLNLILGSLFAIVSLLFLDPVLMFFGASKDTLPYAHDYMKVILCGNVVTHMYLGLNAVVRASGSPRMSMYTTLIAVALNAVFNYTFIFIVHLGIQGSALGTVCSQIVALAITWIYLLRPSALLRIKKDIFRWNNYILRQILMIGLSPFCLNSLACLVVILINNSLLHHGGDLYIGAYGITNRIAFLTLMVVLGLNQGMQPIVGYNYGAMKMDRARKGYWYSVVIAVSIGLINASICFFFPDMFCRLFTTDEQLIAIAREPMWIINLTMPLAAFQMVSTSFFQSIGRAKEALFLATNRSVLFLIPALLIFPNLWGVEGVWWSLPCADIVSACVVSCMIAVLFKRIRQQESLYQS